METDKMLEALKLYHESINKLSDTLQFISDNYEKSREKDRIAEERKSRRRMLVLIVFIISWFFCNMSINMYQSNSNNNTNTNISTTERGR